MFTPDCRGRISSTSSFGVGTILNYRCERGFLLEGGDRVVTRRCTVMMIMMMIMIMVMMM